MVELPGENLAKDVLHETSKQGGPIAVMAIMLVAAMLAGIGCIGYLLIPVMRDYVAASTHTLERNATSFRDLADSMKLVHQSHAAMMEATEIMQIAVTDNGSKLELLQQSVDQMAKIIAEAQQMMQNVPQQRAEHTRLLQQIDAGIQQLAEELKNVRTGAAGLPSN